jgi:hypothetical protein
MALSYSVQKNTTPWDALLDEVRSLAGQVAFLDQKIGEVTRVGGDDSLLDWGQTGAAQWVAMRADRGDKLARVSKMAIDAGVAQVLITRVELQGQLMFQAAREGIAAAVAASQLSLTEDQQLELVASIAREVVRLEADQERKAVEALKTLDGELG